MIWLGLALAAALVWAVLLLGRGMFWRFADQVERRVPPAPPAWPLIVAIVPARNEAALLPVTLPSLLRAYSGRMDVILVDDQSDDGTAEAARTAALEAGRSRDLVVLSAGQRPAGWAGKTWAMRQGAEAAMSRPDAPELLLFTDADIAYGPAALDPLVARFEPARSEPDRLVLASAMVKLRCQSLAEKLLAPAFVYFFAMLYPFAWVGDPRRRTAAAAGGCMLVRAPALRSAGGLDAIRDALIDDVALGTALKRQGPVWLGVSSAIRSLRAYPTFADFGAMVARTAYTELRYSPLRLVGALAGLGLTFFVAPAAAIFAEGPAQAVGFTVWLAILASFAPIAQQYDRTPVFGFLLPLIAACYCWFTVLSFWRHVRGVGVSWKGRVQTPTRRRSG